MRVSLITSLVVLLFGLTLAGGANAQQALMATPDARDFGVVTVGSYEEDFEVFTIRNNQEESIVINELSLKDTYDFVLLPEEGKTPCGEGPLKLEPGASCTVGISFQPFTDSRVITSLQAHMPGGEIIDLIEVTGIGSACGC